jgi:hypothetical protein
MHPPTYIAYISLFLLILWIIGDGLDGMATVTEPPHLLTGHIPEPHLLPDLPVLPVLAQEREDVHDWGGGLPEDGRKDSSSGQ